MANYAPSYERHGGFWLCSNPSVLTSRDASPLPSAPLLSSFLGTAQLLCIYLDFLLAWFVKNPRSCLTDRHGYFRKEKQESGM